MIKRLNAAMASTCGLLCLCSAASLAADEDLRTGLLNTVDNLGATAEGLNMTPLLQDQIATARERVKNAAPGELEAIPADLRSSVRILELSSAQMRLRYDVEVKPAKGDLQRLERVTELPAQGLEASAPYDDEELDDPAYPNVSWDFGFEDPGEPDESDDDSGSGSGTCSYPGYAVTTRFDILNTAVALEAVKDIAEQACNQDILGANTSLLCVVTDIAAYVAIGIDANQELCNDAMTAAEVTATWNGLQTVHSNVQNVYDDLGLHDSAISSQLTAHDEAIAAQLGTHDYEVKVLLQAILGKQDQMLGNQVTIIELLNTPQGQRPDYPNKP